MSGKFLVCATLAFYASLTWSEESLCEGRERIVFSCQIGRKLLSVCAVGNDLGQFIYRFGKVGAVELEYPKKGVVERSDFRVVTAPLYGGGMTTLSFSRGEYDYRVFSKISRSGSGNSPEDREPVFEDGLDIRKGGKLLKHLACDDGGAGFREDIERFSGK